MTLEELKEKTKALNIELSDDMINKFDKYAHLLQEWNEKMNLTAITEYEEIIEKHFYDCLLPLKNVGLSGKVCDVGSGAGFPGLVWKIVNPEVEFVLVEPTGKRCTFLNEVINQLGLEKITVINKRAEEYVLEEREVFDYVTARAVANLRVLSELCIPLIKVNGMFVALKGMHGDEEAEAAKYAMDVLGAELVNKENTNLDEGDNRVNLYYKKVKATPNEYPRNYGRIKKKPL